MTRPFPRWIIIALVGLLLTAACVGNLPINPLPDPTRSLSNPTKPAGPGAAVPAPIVSPAPGEPVDTTGLIREPVTAADRANAELVATTDIPVADLRALAVKYKGLPADTPAVTCTAPKPYAVGDQETFMAFNNDTQQRYDVTATLITVTDHAYMWLDNRWLSIIDRAQLIRSAQRFSNEIYARDRSLFGSELSPGIDCDPRIHILNLSGTAAGGYFWSVDQFPKAVRSDSNEKDVLYIDVENNGGPSAVGSDYYDGTIAHEFQHLILYHQDPNEDTWISEGMSELAMSLNNADSPVDAVAAQAPEVQLNAWPDGGVADARHYGTAYSFMLYVWDRFGDRGVQTLAGESANGLAGVQAMLDQLEPGKSVDDFVADWLTARLIDDPSIDGGRYGYAKVDRAKVTPRPANRNYPYVVQDSTPQYAGAYLSLAGDRDVTIDFAGSTKAQLLDTQPHSGQYFWWSNRGDTADLTLTREFDLSGVSQATLTYWTWYSLEKNWDYAYLSVSTDGGRTWQIVQTPSGTDYNPVNSNYGWGYTGNSGGGDRPQWIHESVDLSRYAGQKIKVQFNVINDLAVNLPGFAIDDVSVPQINYADDFESGGGGWQSGGFVRTNNFVPQHYVVQLVATGLDGHHTVSRLPLNDDNTASWDVPLSRLRDAVLIVSPMAVKTTEVAHFNWSAAQK